MKRPDIHILMKDRGPTAKFFVQSPFRSFGFVSVTSMCFGGFGYGVYLLFLSWHRSNLLGVLFSLIAMLQIVRAWRAAYLTHASIRSLFEDGQIKELENGSALDSVLKATRHMILFGFQYAFLAFIFALVGALILYLR